MDFIKRFTQKGGCYYTRIGSAIFSNGNLRISLPNTKRVLDKGYIDGGFGVVTQTIEPKKSPRTLIVTKIDMNMLPPELTGKDYKFLIPAEQISENEFVFLYKNAKMLNRK